MNLFAEFTDYEGTRKVIVNLNAVAFAQIKNEYPTGHREEFTLLHFVNGEQLLIRHTYQDFTYTLYRAIKEQMPKAQPVDHNYDLGI